jgi:predicted nucleotidyltransferase
VGVVGQLRTALERLSGIQEAYLYGSFAQNQQDASSDIDVLVIGHPNQEALEGAVRKLERQLRREINYTLLSPEEFKARRTSKDAFLQNAWQHKTITLVPEGQREETKRLRVVALVEAGRRTVAEGRTRSSAEVRRAFEDRGKMKP